MSPLPQPKALCVTSGNSGPVLLLKSDQVLTGALTVSSNCGVSAIGIQSCFYACIMLGLFCWPSTSWVSTKVFQHSQANHSHLSCWQLSLRSLATYLYTCTYTHTCTCIYDRRKYMVSLHVYVHVHCICLSHFYTIHCNPANINVSLYQCCIHVHVHVHVHFI